ncbi:3-ketoacyl-ACP reductase [Azospirillum thiophilum]|uniref:3-ketoacyl-ACP reductase n=1 Tax=Azospirillum thiophilum TaxID=528244 RepID=A0AAC8ZUX6_9PROT|nr:3-ketoacyl-ACP reductase FabG2 [Azospirillum thiophilum]ALG72923.1 3-ketoacyl-ACP reductase [Azospirillum thiophilum]KJR64161.1 3-ketoacyl-ACP reductase [Azospirillum thiophilum]
MTRRILVTGASKGIGRAIAERLARDGFAITVHYGRDRDGAETTLDAIRAAGSDGRILGFDISDRAGCLAALEAELDAHGSYYGVVLNAGIARDAAFPALSDEDWDSVLRTNMDGFYNVLKPLVLPMVSARAGGRIVTLSSVSGLTGNRGQVNYSAAKAGIIGATKALAVELAKRNITVNCVAPGVIETQMIDGIPMDEVMKAVPMRRLGRPAEVAAAVAFLCSDEAGYVTRQVISVNGGMV